jgi:hypothetical protein
MFENKKYLPYLLIILVVLIGLYFYFGSAFTKSGAKTEGFISTRWSTQTIQNFLNYEQTKNPNLIFDVDVIQQQATEAEVKTLLETGKWPWDDETKKFYMDAVKSNTMLKTSPSGAMEQARTIYNQTIIKEMLSWSAAEGQFLLRGAYSAATNANENDGSGTYGIDSGLITKNNNLIRCGIDSNNNVVLQQTENMGNDGITGAHKKKTTTIDYNKLPSLLPGFRFINSPCDPCAGVNSPPKYTCPFSLTSKDPSPIWRSLWGLQSSSSSASSNENVNPNSFPLLNELKSELNTLFPETGITAAKTPTTPTPAPTTSTTTQSVPAPTTSVSSTSQQNVNNALSRLTTSLSSVLNKPNVSTAIANSIHSFASLIENPQP